MGKTWRFAGVNFSHMHMGDLLQHVADDPRAELVAICDENRDAMRAVEASLGKNNVEAAKKIGALIAERAKKAGVEECYFDRGGFLFHGKIKALADAAREGGLKF